MYSFTDMQPTAAAATPLNIIIAPLTHAIPAGAALTHASTNALRQQPPMDTPVTKRGESTTAAHDFVGVATINTPAFAAETDEAATAAHTGLDTGSVQTAATAAVAAVTCVSDTEKTDGNSTAMAAVETAAERSRNAAVSAQTTQQCNTLQHTATHCNTLQHTATHCSALGDVTSAVETPDGHMQSAPVETLKTNNTKNDNNHAVSTRTEKKSATAQEMAPVEETQVDELVVPTQLTRQKQDTASRCAPPRLNPSPPRAQTSEQHLASFSVDTTLKSAATSDTPTHAPKPTSICSSKHTGTTAANVAHVATVTTGTHTGGFWFSKGALVHLVCLVVVAVLLGAGAVMLHEGSLFSPAALGAYSKGRPLLLTLLARASSSASATSAAVSRAGASAASAASGVRTTSMTRMSVEWAQYVRAIAHTCALRPAASLLDSTPQQRVEGFRAKDLDGSGRWSLDELREAMRDEGDLIDEARADIILAAMDIDGDSALSFEEADGYAQRWLPPPFSHSPASASDGDSNTASTPQDSTQGSTQDSTEDSTEGSRPHEPAPMSSAPLTSSARAKTDANAEEGVPASATAATHPATAATHPAAAAQRPDSDSQRREDEHVHVAPAAWLHALETAARASTDSANLQQKNTSGDTKDVGVVGAPSLGAMTREQGNHMSAEKMLKQAHSSSLDSSSWNDGVDNDTVSGEKVVLDKMSGEKVLLDKLPGDSLSCDTVLLLTSNTTESSSMNAAWVWDSASAMLTASNIPELTQSLLVRMAASPCYASFMQFVAAVAEFARDMMRGMCAMADHVVAGVTSKVFNGTATAYFAALNTKDAGVVVGVPSLGTILREQGNHMSAEKMLKQGQPFALESSSLKDSVNDSVDQDVDVNLAGAVPVLGAPMSSGFSGSVLEEEALSGVSPMSGSVLAEEASNSGLEEKVSPGGSREKDLNEVGSSSFHSLSLNEGVDTNTQSLLVRMAESPYYASFMQFVAAVAEFARDMMRGMCAMADGALAGVTSKVFNGTTTAYFAALKNAGMPA